MKLIDEIERAIADGRYSPAGEAIQLQRLEILRRAFERGGEDAAWHADVMFVGGGTD